MAMIRSIKTIKDFGLFNDFRWPAGLLEFKQFNLIYGWNYSGKTTLSRAFRCFEEKQVHPDFAEAQVKFKTDDGTLHQLSNPDTAPNLCVFNSDFVIDNLRFETGQPSPILVLGAGDIEKQKDLKSKKVEQHDLTMMKEENERQLLKKTEDISNALTHYARDLIKNPLGVPDYNKTNFEPIVIQATKSPQNQLLSEEVLEEYLSVYRSTEMKPELKTIIKSLSSVTEFEERTKLLLKRVITDSKQIPRLKQNATIESWVNEGRPLHEDKDSCQFCGQPLPEDLLTHLAEHFSAEYENLMKELNLLSSEIQNAQEEDILLNHKSDFYPELAKRYVAEKKEVDQFLEDRRSTLEELKQILYTKKTKAFTPLQNPPIIDPAPKITSAIKAINKTILKHNTRSAEFDKKRREAFNKIVEHYAKIFIRDERYIKQQEQIGKITSTIEEQTKKLGVLDTKIRTLEQALSEASKGAERINELLAAYFGKDDLRIQVSDDNRFLIVRGQNIAKNLSEGEKTAIAFAYFITRVQDGRHSQAETIVVVDDPVSSLDANHIFNTYAMIKTQLADSLQLFIFTHNYEFYNLIRDWTYDDEEFKKEQKDWKKWSVYLISRTDNNIAMLEEIPNELLKFKSEYHYLFSTLYHFHKAEADDFDRLLSLPNLIRRFMEAFGGIMIPLSMGLHSKMDRLFPDKVESERVWKFINYYSHNTTISRSLTVPDLGESKMIVEICLRAVENWNSSYFKDLETAIT